MNWLLHLWAQAPLGIRVKCPAPLPGEPADPGGTYDPLQLGALWNSIAITSLIVVLALVLGCYLLPRASLGPRFVRAWWLGLAGSAAACFLIPLAVGLTTEIRMYAGSCTTRPAAYPVELSASLLTDRMFAGLLWGMLAFAVLSLAGTQLLGRSRLAGGFFHNRGCPWPRWNPTQG
jgi:hypothetical protein